MITVVKISSKHTWSNILKFDKRSSFKNCSFHSNRLLQTDSESPIAVIISAHNRTVSLLRTTNWFVENWLYLWISWFDDRTQSFNLEVALNRYVSRVRRITEIQQSSFAKCWTIDSMCEFNLGPICIKLSTLLERFHAATAGDNVKMNGEKGEKKTKNHHEKTVMRMIVPNTKWQSVNQTVDSFNQLTIRWHLSFAA